jgi:hypothetical protein
MTHTGHGSHHVGRVMTGLRRDRRRVEIARFKRADADVIKAEMSASGMCVASAGETIARATSIVLRPFPYWKVSYAPLHMGPLYP